MFLWITLYILLLVNYGGSSFSGDLCDLDNGNIGICTRLELCESAINDLTTKKKKPKICSFEGSNSVVCCPKQNTSVSIDSTENILNNIGQDYGKVSLENCKIFASLVFLNVSSPTLIPDVNYEIQDTCAIQEENYRESSIKAREFPHLASIGYDSIPDKLWKCSGALISQQHVLTAATCWNLPQLGIAKYVRIGSTSIRENFYHEKPLQYSNIKEFVKHPKFDQSTLLNNLAIIKLETPVKFTSIIRPACLGVNRSAHEEVINVGWGTFNSGYLNNEPLKNLIRIIDSRNCNNLGSNQMCVEQIPGTKWQNCLVDQGSPLQEYNENYYCTYNIIGVVSDWKDCAKRQPGVYTNVSTYIPWIEKIVWERQ